MLKKVVGEVWGVGCREMGKWGSGEMGKWGNGEMGRPLRARCGGKWGSGEVGKLSHHPITSKPYHPISS
ncbi:MAG: hypothetical protein IM515_08735 [Microcystis sp. M44BS1]|nr:hypothetical protein [Microcystis sp. M44BS1]MCA2608608.1 hypothetical protein [Microcystis sp. M27BS1]